MSISKKEDATYELIINTAKQLFFKEGKFNATTQEIADAAGVNRTLINYYFRSRNTLFELILKEAKEEEIKKQEIIVLSDLPVREKLELFMDHFFEMAKEYPYMEIYIVTQMNQTGMLSFKDNDHIKRMLDKFYVALEVEMASGNIEKMEPIQFILNFISMLSFPVCMRPLIQESMELSNEEYEKILSDRKQVILKSIFKN
ncbi:MAG TPA: TetR/AcrR family transcriptional regulator [Gelidibacter sp.]|uniref:TetR/AcrR family transcriptional regulator n=1 Tax=Gelidibacter sp. TaxID=2018083 RepID=UPI002BDEF72D|nr:TetR/AcrR family transcriptional regulator [Gelidibacter sp.]HXJ98089.1 TetR/AcrR family transcriptional regulator [Gelidibacter sp.]